MSARAPRTEAPTRAQSTLADLPIVGEVLSVAQVDRAHALAVIRAPLPRRWSGQMVLLAQEMEHRIKAQAIAIRSDEEHLVWLTASQPLAGGFAGSLVIQGPGGENVLSPEEVGDVSTTCKRLAEKHLATLPGKARRGLLERTRGLIGARGGSRAASEALLEVRDATRVRLPASEARPDANVAVNVEAIFRLDETAYYLEGWAFARTSPIRRLTVLTPEGRAVEVQERIFRYPRPDVAELFRAPDSRDLGFISYVQLSEPSCLDTSWLLQAHTADEAVEVAMPQVSTGGVDLRTMILHDLELERLPDQELRAHHVRPALARLEHRLTEAVEIATVDQLGSPPRDPPASIIIPLYHRLEFIESQMAEFVHDPEIAGCDLLYVLDSPAEADHCRSLAEELFQLYQVPFRLAVLTGNGGFAKVNNLGASLSRGRMLVLLNSDVLPSGPGWVSKLLQFYEARPKAGVVAPKLLYEDGSIQHAGLYFFRPATGNVWSNEHYFKGLHREFPAANVARPVPAVTGACLMITAELYHALGGMSAEYIRGDYEDSDLCLRLRGLGYEAWYAPEVELYHLEGQSYPTAERALISGYNKWLHTHIWCEQLEALSA